MRAVRLSWMFLFLVAAGLGLAWVTAKREIAVRQRAALEWNALTLMDAALRAGRHPMAADAAVFLSVAAIDAAAAQLVGARMTPRTEGGYDVSAAVRDARVSASLGLLNIAISLELEKKAGSTGVSLVVDGNLAFKGFSERVGASGRRERTIDFAVSILRVEPRMALGFADLRGRGLLADAIAAGLMEALDGNLVISVPVEDRLALELGLDRTEVIPAQAGSVTAAFALPRSIVERRIDWSTPLVLESGVWLLGDLTGRGDAPAFVPPAVPTTGALDAQLAALRASVAGLTRPLEQNRDLVLWLKGSGLTGIVTEVARLSDSARTLSVDSVAAEGHLARNGDSYVRLSNPRSATGRVVVGRPSANWRAGEGVIVAVPMDAYLSAGVHAHFRPVPVGGGFGTTVGLEGRASRTLTGRLSLAAHAVGENSAILLGLDFACDAVPVELRTDGRLVVGPMRTDVPSVGVRWNVQLPQSLGDPTVLLDDLPRRIPLEGHMPLGGQFILRPAHAAVEVTLRSPGAQMLQDGFIVTADLAIRTVDGVDLPPDVIRRREALARAARDERRAANAPCRSDRGMRVLFGQFELGPNGEVWRRLQDAYKDLTQGPGPNNDLVGQNGFVGRTLQNAQSDITRGPGRNNDLVGRNGFVRRRLGF